MFKKAVNLTLGAGTDIVCVCSTGAAPDAGQEVVIWSTFVVTGWNGWPQAFGNELFPNGGHIQFL